MTQSRESTRFPTNARIRKQAKELCALELMPLSDLCELYGRPKPLAKRDQPVASRSGRSGDSAPVQPLVPIPRLLWRL